MMNHAATQLPTAHTFGRNHMEPPPLPSSIQAGMQVHGNQMGESTIQNMQAVAGNLPHDFDHLVRSVGEW